MLPSVSLVTDFRWRQNEAKTKKLHTRCSRVYHWCLKINYRWRPKVIRPKKSLIFLLHVSTESPLFYSFKKEANAASLLHYIFNEKPSKCAKSPAYHKRKFRLLIYSATMYMWWQQVAVVQLSPQLSIKTLIFWFKNSTLNKLM